MILDANLRLSNAQDLSSGTGSGVLSTNSYDLGLTSGRDVGVGQSLFIYLLVTTALEGAGDTLDVELVSSANADLSSPTVHYVIDTFAAEAAANTVIKQPIAHLDGAMLRYLGVRY